MIGPNLSISGLSRPGRLHPVVLALFLSNSDLKGSADLGMRRKETAGIAFSETSLIQVEKFRLIDASVELPITAMLYAKLWDELAGGEIDVAARHFFDFRFGDRCAV